MPVFQQQKLLQHVWLKKILISCNDSVAKNDSFYSRVQSFYCKVADHFEPLVCSLFANLLVI